MPEIPTPDRFSPPDHVAIIMDGNGRWAKARGLPRTMGHRQGVEAVRRAAEAAQDLGVRYLTLFGFSSENWSRPASEIGDLMGLLRLYLKSHLKELHEAGARLRIIGQPDLLPEDIAALIRDAETLTRDNSRLFLTVALSYGGRQEIVEAARRIAVQAAEGKLDPAALDEQAFGSFLYTHGLPDPDVLIRTSGEKRLSNFLLWQMAYTEFVFTDTLWPDFSRKDLEQALQDYAGRERRFGKVATHA
ncbi:MAG: isoprenyl transferase [Pseudomonadota bacterium]|nr:isoprenyl transferase [Pseudomonadota bacterium]